MTQEEQVAQALMYETAEGVMIKGDWLGDKSEETLFWRCPTCNSDWHGHDRKLEDVVYCFPCRIYYLTVGIDS